MWLRKNECLHVDPVNERQKKDSPDLSRKSSVVAKEYHPPRGTLEG